MSDSEDTVSSVEDFPEAPPMTAVDSQAGTISNAVGVSDEAEMSSVSFGIPTPARRASEPMAMFSQVERDSKLLLEAFGPDLVASDRGNAFGENASQDLTASNQSDEEEQEAGDSISVETADSRALFHNSAFEAEAGLPELISSQLFFKVPQASGGAIGYVGS